MATVDFVCSWRAHWARKMTTADMVSHRPNSLTNTAAKSAQPTAVARQFVRTRLLHGLEVLKHALSYIRRVFRHRQRLEPRVLQKKKNRFVNARNMSIDYFLTIKVNLSNNIYQLFDIFCL